MDRTMTNPVNPFNITKAVDFNDEQIHTNWVDLPSKGGFNNLAKPTSPMPMVIVGSKGSGKTHLMRHFSYPLQVLRHEDHLLTGIKKEGYIGLYIRCEGLNSERFSRKGQTEEKWDAIFSYYMDLWLAQIALLTLRDFLVKSGILSKYEKQLCKSVIGLFQNCQVIKKALNINDLVNVLIALKNDIDFAVNNCAVTRELDVQIYCTRGETVFGIPEIITKHISEINQIKIIYLIDEFENLLAPQQRYINTLVRERRDPSSIKIGSRLYGIKTRTTYCADEEIKEGSEYERLPLDELLRANTQYKEFTKRFCARRIIGEELTSLDLEDEEKIASKLSDYYDDYEKDPLYQIRTKHILEKYKGRERPYFLKLKKQIKSAAKRKIQQNLSPKNIDRLIDLLRVPEYPILEKVNILLLYNKWARTEDLYDSAQKICSACAEYIKKNDRAGSYGTKLQHFGSDLLAQLLRETGQKVEYVGIDTFIRMSSGVPRNLLIILKFIHNWAIFNGETPFGKHKISKESQNAGVREASQWFFRDAKIPGENGQKVHDSIRRIATLFREIRFSDKPSECSLSTFCIDPSAISANVREILRLSYEWSLIIRVDKGQKDRNSQKILDKYRLNSMLCPHWDLPIASRGAINLNEEEANIIFDSKDNAAFRKLTDNRCKKMQAPFSSHTSNKQMLIPGIK